MNIRSLSTFALSLLGVSACSAGASADPTEWYGASIGRLPPTGARERVRGVQGGTDLPSVAPWDEATGMTDRQGQLAEMNFSESCCEVILDGPPDYVPKRYKSDAKMIVDGDVAKEYVIARLGQPSSYREWGTDGDRSRMLYWDFSKHKGGLLHAVLLTLSRRANSLTVIGSNDPMAQLPTPPSPPQR